MPTDTPVAVTRSALPDGAATEATLVYAESSLRAIARQYGINPDTMYVGRRFGHATVGTTETDINFGGAFWLPSSATALEVLSSDAADTAGGAGLQGVSLALLDNAWAFEQGIAAPLSGTTPVSIDSGNTKFRVLSLRGQRKGATGQVGTITLREAGGGATVAQIMPGHGESHSSFFCVPEEMGAVVTHVEVLLDSGKDGMVSIYLDRRDDIGEFEPIQIAHSPIFSDTKENIPDDGIPLALGANTPIPERTDIRVTGLVSSTTGDMHVTLYFIYGELL